MRTPSRHVLSAGMALALPLITTHALEAQDPTQEVPQCTATIEPAEIHNGQKAVSVTAVLSEQIGPVTQFRGPEDIPLVLADTADIPRDQIPDSEGEPRPIMMTPEGNAAILWLNTVGVEPAELEVRLHASEESYCTATLTVIEPGHP